MYMLCFDLIYMSIIDWCTFNTAGMNKLKTVLNDRLQHDNDKQQIKNYALKYYADGHNTGTYKNKNSLIFKKSHHLQCWFLYPMLLKHVKF
jgi:hypothetical protein